MRRMGGKAAMGLAVVLGLGAAYAVYHYQDRINQEAQPVPMAQVLTAAKDIPPRTVITPDMLRLAEVPASVKLPQALAAPAQAEGQVSKLPIAQGEQMLPSKLFAGRGDSGLAFVVPSGKRAVAVGVTEVVGSGGLIVPGDSVDVLVVLDTKSDEGQQAKSPASPAVAGASAKPSPSATPTITAVSQYVLQNVEVLAVAQTLEGDVPAESGTQKVAGALGAKQNQPAPKQAAPAAAAKTVTLAVSPAEAERLVLAESKGQIRLVLRPHGDDSTMDVGSNSLFADLGGMVGLKTEPVSQ